MWLIDTSTLKLKFFVAPPEQYAILSHTWGEEEVSFQEMGKFLQPKRKLGWQKIQQTCQLAASENFKYAWVDTCCIDKSSSAELSEAINSMYAWYGKATVCYAWLNDFDWVKSSSAGLHAAFKGCKWFTRGWTLQELIAPREVRLLDRDWKLLGTKADLPEMLSSVTGIDTSVLTGKSSIDRVPIGRRMSWAARRHTTRAEDIAYCLLGIFGINMPLLYGEGSKAFIRLQEAIARDHGDLTLFAWARPYEGYDFSGVFADEPSWFEKCSSLVTHDLMTPYSTAFSLSNKGVRFETFMMRGSVSDETFILDLRCLEEYDSSSAESPDWLGIFLASVGDGYVRKSPGQYASPRTWDRLSAMGIGKKGHSDLGKREFHVRTLLTDEEARLMTFSHSKIMSVHFEAFESPELIQPPSASSEPGYFSDLVHASSTKGNEIMGVAFRVGPTAEGNTVRCAVICGLQWQDSVDGQGSPHAWGGVYCESDDSVRVIDHWDHAVLTVLEQEFSTDEDYLSPSEVQAALWDIMLESAGDANGFIEQKRLPNHRTVPGVSVVLAGKETPKQLSVEIETGSDRFWFEVRLK